MQNMNRKLLNSVFIIIGLGLPFLLVSIISRWHGGDVQTFIDWSNYWSKSVKDMYVNCSSCNYPFFGFLFSAGLISWIQKLTTIHGDELHQAFRIILAIGDGIIFLLNVILLRILKVKHAILIGLIITVLPSTWAGSALWGQIDGIVQIFMLLSVICYLVSMEIIVLDTKKERVTTSLTYFFLGGVMLASGVLTKQLFLFSVPVLSVIWLSICFLLLIKYGLSAFLKAVVITFATLIIFLLPDLYLNIPENYYSHLHYTTAISGHWKKIAGNGFNIWVFFEPDIWSSSTKSIYGIFSPLRIGLILYSIFMLIILSTLILKVYRFIMKNNSEPTGFSHIAALFILSIGLSHLGFNVLITGTHERYMYHGYPFLMIALFYFWLSEDKLKLRWVVLLGVSALAYGVYVLSIINIKLSLFFPFQNLYFQAAMHLFLLIFLLAFWLDLTLRPLDSKINLSKPFPTKG
jgi:hypothetical protein